MSTLIPADRDGVHDFDNCQRMEMADERTRSLQLSKYYCTERTLEIKAELLRLAAESAELKTELDMTAEPRRQGAIRRRRAYLNRRNDELKGERAALAAELQVASDGLRSASQSAEAATSKQLDGRTPEA
ncbi:hypothetical protein [Reyranella sp.]|uniref:hypothetical protein n=1 Tax=Reyranella sp. TaxID=1929291 RepID=UPI0025E04926|nr:hypothetical protein [Reyranella sp.]